MEGECEWEEDGEESLTFETDCGKTFVLNEGVPSEHDMKYCCFCGKKIIETEHIVEDEEWD